MRDSDLLCSFLLGLRDRIKCSWLHREALSISYWLDFTTGGLRALGRCGFQRLLQLSEFRLAAWGGLVVSLGSVVSVGVSIGEKSSSSQRLCTAINWGQFFVGLRATCVGASRGDGAQRRPRTSNR